MQAADCVVGNVVAPNDSLENLWSSIIVPDDVKDRLLRHAALAFAVRPQLDFTTTALQGLVLLYGPPGTGKTTLARGLGQELARVGGHHVRLLEINPHGLMSAEHGRSQQMVHELMTNVIPGEACDDLTIVVLDEVESMAVARSEASLGANPVDVHRATDAVLTALDDLTRTSPKILFVATSNFTGGLDDAFIARADAAIEVPLPSAAGIRAILEETLRGYGAVYPQLKELAESNKLAKVAAAMVGLDGRAARKLVAAAAASTLETALDPGLLSADLLLAAATAQPQNVGGRRPAT